MSKKGGLSLLFGAIIGGLAALFFAPVKGTEMRKKIKNEVDKGGIGLHTMSTELKDMYGDMKKSFERWLKTEDVTDVIKKGKKAIDQAKTKGKEVLENIVNEIEIATDNGMKTVKTTKKVVEKTKPKKKAKAAKGFIVSKTKK